MSIALSLALALLVQQVQIITDDSPGISRQIPPPTPPTGKGIVSGTVVNAITHQPIRKAQVSINGATSVSAVTDGSGAFTFRALPAGGYVVSANRDSYYTPPGANNFGERLNLGEDEQKDSVTVRLWPSSSIAGRVVDEDEAPIAGCNVSATKVLQANSLIGRGQGRETYAASTEADGTYRIPSLQGGHYRLQVQCSLSFPAPHGFMKRRDPQIPHEGYAPVVYGDGSPGANAGLTVAPGGDLTGVDFHLRLVPVFMVRGTLSGGDSSALAGAQITLNSSGQQGGANVMYSARFDPSESVFSFRNVPAGSYDLVASVFNADRVYEARQVVEVGKSTVTEANLRLVAGAPLTGSVQFEDSSQRMDNLQVSLEPLTENYRGPYPMATLKSDDTFVFKSILPGRFRLNLPIGYAKSVTLGGVSISAANFELGAGAIGPLQIVVSTKTAQVHVEFTPKPDANQVLSGLLIPEGDSSGASGRIISSGGMGQIDFGGVPPGKYRAYLLATPDGWNLQNQPDVLHRLESRSIPVEVAEGEDKRISGTLISAEEINKAADPEE